LQYPDIRLVYRGGGNPFHHHQDLNRLIRAWCKPDTMIVNEAFWTAFGRLSDIFLPATTSLEPNDLGATSRYRFIIAMKQAIAPVGEACNDFDAFSDLAERFELRDLFTEMEWVRYLYDTASEQASKRGLRWDDFVVRAFNNRGAILAGAVISDQIRRKMGGMSGCTKPCRPKPQLHPPPLWCTSNGASITSATNSIANARAKRSAKLLRTSTTRPRRAVILCASKIQSIRPTTRCAECAATDQMGRRDHLSERATDRRSNRSEVQREVPPRHHPAQCIAESHLPPTQISAWPDLPFKTLPSLGPDPVAVNSQAARTTPPTSRALMSLIAIFVHPAANSMPSDPSIAARPIAVTLPTRTLSSV